MVRCVGGTKYFCLAFEWIWPGGSAFFGPKGGKIKKEYNEFLCTSTIFRFGKEWENAGDLLLCGGTKHKKKTLGETLGEGRVTGAKVWGVVHNNNFFFPTVFTRNKGGISAGVWGKLL